ncbi:MAG TPA: hypothetical protein VFZ79_02570 [Acidimicrobiales bacterium]
MAEPLLGLRVLVAGCDPVARLATVRARPAGPAGSAGLDLGPGVELDVDVADPASLAGLIVELPPTGDPGDLPAALRRRLAALLGPERAAALGTLVADRPDDTVTLPRRLVAGDARRESVAGVAGGSARSVPHAAQSPATGVAPPLQRAALAQVAACAPGVPRLVRAVALLEAAAALHEMSPRLDLRATARHDARVGAELLVDLLADGMVVVPSGRVAGALAPIVRRAVRVLDRDGLLSSRLTALAGDLERGHVARSHGAAPPAAPVPGSQMLGATDPALGDHGFAAAGPGGPTHAPGDAAPVGPALGTGSRSYRYPDRHVRVVIRSLPGAVAEAAATAQRTGTDQVEVRVGGWAERWHGLWARAFDPDDGTLLAAGPLRRDGRDAVARLLVPPRAIGRVEVDITDRPEMPRPSAALAAVGRAIHLGGVAARAERLGDRRSAARRWRQCARAWLGAGDLTRADQALAYAAQVNGGDERAGGRITRPLVSDLIAGPS